MPTQHRLKARTNAAHFECRASASRMGVVGASEVMCTWKLQAPSRWPSAAPTNYMSRYPDRVGRADIWLSCSCASQPG
jgi:hypothetical protein